MEKILSHSLPKISIITVSFNQGRFIEDNILSVINQNYPNVEHIIIDAGSNDETLAILRKYDEHLVWTSEPDRGQSDGLNKGFKKATGEIIGWFNSDDRIPTGALYKVAEYFNMNPNEIAIVGDQLLIDENGNRMRLIKSRGYDYNYLLNEAKGITQNSMFFKKEILENIGYLDDSLHFAMDRDLFIRICKIKPILYVPETLGEFRVQSDSKTSLGTWNFALELIRIRKKYGGKMFGSGNRNDIYVILTEPLRKIKPLRKFVQKIKGVG